MTVYMTNIQEHCVFLLKVTGDSLVLIDEVGGEGSGIERYHEPRHLAVSEYGVVYVSDCYNNRIKVLDENLRYIGQISHQSMTRPIDVELNGSTVYVLCVSNTHSIHVFSLSGYKIQSLILSESRPRVQIEFSRFSLDSRGNFVISDFVGNILFSRLRLIGPHRSEDILPRLSGGPY